MQKKIEPASQQKAGVTFGPGSMDAQDRPWPAQPPSIFLVPEPTYSDMSQSIPAPPSFPSSACSAAATLPSFVSKNTCLRIVSSLHPRTEYEKEREREREGRR